MRELCRPGQCAVHFAKESDERRRHVLDRIVRLDVRVAVYDCGSDQSVETRAAGLRALVTDLLEDKASRLVLESRSERDREDKQVIYETLRKSDAEDGLAYHHQTARQEPLLWVPDAVAWAYGAGGDWRRRLGSIVEVRSRRR